MYLRKRGGEVSFYPYYDFKGDVEVSSLEISLPSADVCDDLSLESAAPPYSQGTVQCDEGRLVFYSSEI